MDKIIVCFLAIALTVQTGCAQTNSHTKVISSFEECVAAGNPVTRSIPAQCMADGQRFIETISKPAINVPAKKKSFCKDECGNGTCEEIVCMAVGCPCSESPDSCPEDCSQ